MSEKIVQFNEEIIKGQLKELVRGSVEETLHSLLEEEAKQLTQAAHYERSKKRQGYRSGALQPEPEHTSGDVTFTLHKCSNQAGVWGTGRLFFMGACTPMPAGKVQGLYLHQNGTFKAKTDQRSFLCERHNWCCSRRDSSLNGGTFFP